MEKAKAANHSRAGFFPNPELKSFEQVNEVIRFEHYSIPTEDACLPCIKRFLPEPVGEAPAGCARGGRAPPKTQPPNVQYPAWILEPTAKPRLLRSRINSRDSQTRFRPNKLSATPPRSRRRPGFSAGQQVSGPQRPVSGRRSAHWSRTEAD